jgi:type VI secretion system protein
MPDRRSEVPEVVPAGADVRAAWAAFLDGAGMAGSRVDERDPEAALRAAGAIFRTMADGIREILISRAAIKGEMRITQTMIRARGNNALKFAATADDAVAALLTSDRPGYMTPLAATREAFADIKSHELAVVAGMQAALLALLRRFDPVALEERLTAGPLDAVLPHARKARYWDAFRQTYGEISREAEDDFQSVFGRSFAETYRRLATKQRGRDE